MTPRFSAIRITGLVVAFVAAWEVCARVDDRWSEGAPLFGRYDQSLLTTTDEYGVTGRPNARYSKWKMNTLGFRGDDVRWDRERILCIGASETFGLYEPEGMEFPRQLERELNRRAGSERYQVVNAGLPGQSLSSFSRRVEKVTGEVRPSVAVIYPSLAIYIDPPPEKYVPSLGSRKSAFQFRIGGKLYTLLNDHVPEFLQTAVTRMNIKIEMRHRTLLERIPESDVIRFQNDLSRLLDRLQSKQVGVLLVTHATRFGDAVRPQDEPVLTAWRALYPELEEGGFLDMEARLNSIIRAEAERRNLKLVDAARWLYGADNFVEFVHFTQQGAGALARAISSTMPGQSDPESSGTDR
jgi:hypothetical protein